MSRRFADAKEDDHEVNRDLAWFALGVLMQKEETDLIVTPDDLDRLDKIKETIRGIDPNKEET